MEEQKKFTDDGIKSTKSPREEVEIKDYEIIKVLKMSYIAEHYFERSRAWFCHKFNHDIVNGKPAYFSKVEREKLKQTLNTIADEIKTLSDQL